MLRDSFVRDSRLLEFFISHFPVNEPESILDFGSGAGRMTKYLYKKYRNQELISIDINSDCINLLRKSFRERENFKLMVHDIIKGKIFDESFDLIIAFQVYPFLEQPEIVIKYIEEIGKKTLLDIFEFPEEAFEKMWQYTGMLNRFQYH